MQNLQRLTGTGGCDKYVCKYIEKIDEKNYIIIEVDREDRMVTGADFLHNTKVTPSKLTENKERQKDNKKAQGQCMNQLEMLHINLKYPEVVTNLDFIKFTTMLLEF